MSFGFTAIVAAILGFVLSMPPGPIAVAVVQQGAHGRVRQGAFLIFGAALIDAVYAYVGIHVGGRLVGGLDDFMKAHPILITIVEIAIVSGLACVGLYHLFWRRRNGNGNGTTPASTEADADASATSGAVDVVGEVERAGDASAPTSISAAAVAAPPPTPSVRRRLRFSDRVTRLSHPDDGEMNLVAAVGAGIGVALANVITFLPFVIASVTLLHKYHLLTPKTHTNPVLKGLFIIGFAVGSYLWLYVVLRIVNHYRRVVPAHIIAVVHHVAGGMFLLFALVFAVKFLRMAIA